MLTSWICSCSGKCCYFREEFDEASGEEEQERDPELTKQDGKKTSYLFWHIMEVNIAE